MKRWTLPSWESSIWVLDGCIEKVCNIKATLFKYLCNRWEGLDKLEVLKKLKHKLRPHIAFHRARKYDFLSACPRKELHEFRLPLQLVLQMCHSSDNLRIYCNCYYYTQILAPYCVGVNMSLAASSAVDKCDPVCGGQRNAGWCLGEVAQTPGFSGRPLFNGPTHFGVCPPRLLKEEGSALVVWAQAAWSPSQAAGWIKRLWCMQPISPTFSRIRIPSERSHCSWGWYYALA